MSANRSSLDRRQILSLCAGFGAVSGSSFGLGSAKAQAAPLRIGVLLPFSGTYAPLGQAIMQAMELYLGQRGGLLAGRAVQFVKLDDESAPPKAADLTSRLVFGEKVDVLIGSVHSGVALAMVKIAREEGLPTLIPNAGADALTRGLCAENIFRTSFANGQVGVASGSAMGRAGIKKVVTLSWKYVAGDETMAGFTRSFAASGGQIIKSLQVPFPDVEFQSAIAQISTLNTDAVFVFMSGGGALKFIKDYAASGLKGKIPLWGPFLTDGIEQTVGSDGDGVKSVLHYAQTLPHAENQAFISAYKAAYQQMPDVYAVQGFDTMQVLDMGLQAVKGDVSQRKALFAGMAQAHFTSPRGAFRLSTAHNPVQNFYVRELIGGQYQVLGTPISDLADDASSCKLP